MAEGLDDRHKGLMRRVAGAEGAKLIRKGMAALKKGIAKEEEGLKDEEKSSSLPSSLSLPKESEEESVAGALRRLIKRKALASKVEQHWHCRWNF